MDKQEKINRLNALKQRLMVDVGGAYSNQGSELGKQRLRSWYKAAEATMTEIGYPKAYKDLYSVMNPPFMGAFIVGGRSDYDYFLDDYGRPANGFLSSMIADIQNDEADSIHKFEDIDEVGDDLDASDVPVLNVGSKDAFIVHGKSELEKIRAARFLEKLGFRAIILHEQASAGRTIIEKLEMYTNVGFAIVLYTPDDVGEELSRASDLSNLRKRARQNVVFEHGLMIGKLGRNKVFTLVSDSSIEIPNDISGVVYISDSNWEIDLAKEIKALGYEFDFNVLI